MREHVCKAPCQSASPCNAKTGNQLACLVWVLLQSTVSHIPNTRENPRSLTAILAPAAARNPERAFSSSVYMQILVFEAAAWGGKQSRYLICKYEKNKKQTHFAVFEPISYLK